MDLPGSISALLPRAVREEGNGVVKETLQRLNSCDCLRRSLDRVVGTKSTSFAHVVVTVPIVASEVAVAADHSTPATITGEYIGSKTHTSDISFKWLSFEGEAMTSWTVLISAWNVLDFRRATSLQICVFGL